MNLNVHQIERIARVLIGAGLIALYFYLAAPLKYISGTAGIILIVTGAIGWCPIYRILGLNFSKK